MRRQRIKDESGYSYWQSVTDASFGLILILLLILMMFMIRILVYNNDKTETKDYEHDFYQEIEEYNDYHYQAIEHNRDHLYDDPEKYEWQGSGGGGDGDGDADESEIERELGEAAVFVRLMDIDTDKIVAEQGVEFELYHRGNLLTLKTYYPEETTYRNYDTREDGTFFVPEKLPLGSYVLKNTTNATGYELASDVVFTIEKDYDWQEPMVITAYVGPEKNRISIRLVDAANTPISVDGTFKVYANTDIITEDGTVRYTKDTLVDTITCDESGTGQSSDLYLGEYRIETNFTEDYFVGNDTNIVTLYSKKSEKGNVIYDIICEKTTITLQVADELYNNELLQGVEYTLTDKSTKKNYTAVTNANGITEFTNLAKDRTYELRQTNTLPYYYADPDITEVYVDKGGYIEGNAGIVLNRSNRKIRIALDVVDYYLKRPITDAVVNVYDSDNNLLLNFVTTNDSKIIEGLEYGNYTVEVEGKNTARMIEVQDTAKEQKFSVTVKNSFSIYILIILGIGIISILTILVYYVIKKRKKK